MKKYADTLKIPIHIHNRGKIYVLVHNYPNKKKRQKK